VRFTVEGVKFQTSGSGVYAVMSDTIGTFEELDLPLGGQELYQTTKFHVWRFDFDASAQTITTYFNETLLFTSNAGLVSNTASSENGIVDLNWVNGGTSMDVYVDYLVVEPGAEESVVTALFDFPRSGANLSTTHRMVAAVNGRCYVDPGSHSFDPPILEGGTPRTIFDFASFKSRLIIARSGRLHLSRWTQGDALAADLPGNPPLGTILRVHRNRLWVAGDEDNPSRLYWSAFGDDETWATATSGGDVTDAGFEDIEPSDGGIITALGPSFHGELIVYKTTGIWRIQGNDPTDFQPYPSPVLGAVGHHAVVNVGMDQFFVSPSGVHSLITTQNFGDYEDAFLSRDIRNLWNLSISRDLLARAWAINNADFDRYELLVPVGAGTLGMFGTQVWCFHYGLRDELHPVGRWSKKLISGGSMCMFFDEDGKQHAFVGGLDGHVDRQDETFCHDFPVHRALGLLEVAL
jgi:hypothetical protein